MASFLPDDPQKQKLVLAGLIPLALAGLFYYFVHTPAVETADELESRVESLTTMNDAQRAIVARFGDDLDRRLAIYQEHITQLEQLIPRREDVPLLINQVTQQARDYQVELVGLNPSNEEPGDYYNRQNYELQVLGDYHSIGAYLASIGSLSRIVRPYEVRIGVEEERTGQPLLRAAFRIETFVMPSDSIPGIMIQDSVVGAPVVPADTTGGEGNNAGN